MSKYDNETDGIFSGGQNSCAKHKAMLGGEKVGGEVKEKGANARSTKLNLT